jgi:hypothetical protein
VTPKLAITTAVLEPTSELIQRCVESHGQTATPIFEWVVQHNTPEANLGVTGSLQWLHEHTTAPIIAFIHSDVELFEQGWDERVLREFDDSKVGVVGLGGALQLGEDDLYKTPYRLTQLRRIDYRSNTRDAEAHGERFTGACDVATLDGFALVVRRRLLDEWVRIPWVDTFPHSFRMEQGWPVRRYPFHSYDNALCVHAHKTGWKVRLVGIDCQHHGGATATTPAYQQWSLEKLGLSDAQVHEQSHLALYEDGRGVLPWRAR